MPVSHTQPPEAVAGGAFARSCLGPSTATYIPTLQAGPTLFKRRYFPPKPPEPHLADSTQGPSPEMQMLKISQSTYKELGHATQRGWNPRCVPRGSSTDRAGHEPFPEWPLALSLP